MSDAQPRMAASPMVAICFMVMNGWSFNGFLARCDAEDWDNSGSKGRDGRARPVIGGGGLIAANRCRHNPAAVAGDKAEAENALASKRPRRIVFEVFMWRFCSPPRIPERAVGPLIDKPDVRHCVHQ